jgi:hypothetical protein
MLYSGKGGGGKQSDPYKTAVIDIIVAEVQSTPGEDRCVLMLGYDAQIKEMFQVGSRALLHMRVTAHSSISSFVRMPIRV